ncbi:MAG: hypothetical protein ACQET5_09545 [Halobacteriota archaeon]
MSSEGGKSEESIEILLVEPTPGDSRLYTESFKHAKILNNLHVVTDGESALDLVQQRDPYTDSPRPELILLEPQLPGRDGMETLAESVVRCSVDHRSPFA